MPPLSSDPVNTAEVSQQKSARQGSRGRGLTTNSRRTSHLPWWVCSRGC